MSWKKELRPASFRGVPFFVSEAERSGGRRVVGYEYPERDNPSSEDLGRKQTEWTFEAYVIGSDYLSKKNDLIKALENESSPGELIHPFYGALQVRCTEIKVKESMTDDGGMATFSLSFKEAGLLVDPMESVDRKSAILSKSNALKEKSLSKFEKAFSIAKAPGSLIAKAQDKINAAISLIENSPVKAAAQTVADYSYQVRNMKASITDLMQAPGKLAKYFNDSVDALKSAIGTKKDTYKASQTMMMFAASEVDKAYPATPDGEKEKKNAEAMNQLVQEIGVSNSIEAVIDLKFDSFTDASVEKEKILDRIDVMLEQNTDDEVFHALTDLRATFIENFPSEDESLPNLSTHTTKDTLPALVVAYQLYGDCRRDDEIVKRNKISNPGFIKGGTDLEVLNV